MNNTRSAAMLSTLSQGHKVSSSGAGVAILCFFLPWVLVSCNDQPVASFTGWQLAAGTTIGSGFGASQLPGTPILFVALLAGFGVLALAYLALRRGHLHRLDGFGSIGLGSITLVLLFAQFNAMQGNASQQGVTVTTQYGLWGAVLGYLAVVAGGIFNLRQPIQTMSVTVREDATSEEFTTAPVGSHVTIPAHYTLGNLNFDLITLRKSARWPLVAAAALALILLLNASLGSFWSVAFTLVWAFAGLTYTRAALTTGASLDVFDLAVNGGALSAIASVAYQILAQIVFSLQKRGSGFDFASSLAAIVEALFVGALAAVAWYAYQQEQVRAV